MKDTNDRSLGRYVFTFVGAMLLVAAGGAARAETVMSTEVIDLAATHIQGLPRSLAVTIYRDAQSTAKRPLIVLVPRFSAYLGDSPYRRQAEYFVKAGYVAALPHLDIYNDGTRLPVYDSRLQPDLATDTTPYAIEVLALVATLTQASGAASSAHVIVGEGFGSIVAARYASLSPPGCKGIVLITPGLTEAGGALRNISSLTRASEDAFRQLGGKVSVPSLWLYARGNMRLRESSVNDFFAAFKSGSPAANLQILPGIGNMDGDELFPKADIQATWGEPVSKFLGALDWR
jgi:dienelactone hydrolase